jgi:hypothetical protein
MIKTVKYYWLSGLFAGLFSAITIMLAVDIADFIVKNICFPGNTLVLIVFAFVLIKIFEHSGIA